MQQTKTLLAASALLSLTTLTAEAALTAGTADGQRVVYSSISDVTWTGDANLLGTMIQAQGYDTVVNAIIAASPIIYNTANGYDTPSYSGYYNVTSADFDTTDLGLVSWFGAKAFTGYLNSINYAGSNQWALPSAGANPQVANQTDGQFGQLYYNELNAGIDGILHDGSFQNSGNTGPFINAQTYVYWLGTEHAPYPDGAWFFGTNGGYQGDGHKSNQSYAWAISPGNVAAVPVPAAAWLFGSGLISLIGWRRRYTIR